jgi:hypothetical protein
MAGLVPAVTSLGRQYFTSIAFRSLELNHVGGRDKPGHEGGRLIRLASPKALCMRVNSAVIA